MRKIALDQGLSLNEHALSPVDENKTIIESAEKILCDSEEKVYETLGLQYVPPELREDSGEIEAARAHRLPRLIERADIVADLHMHSTWSDGKNTIREMVEACLKRGHQYMVITDHSRSLGIANGLSIERLLAQAEEVRQINDEMGDRIQVLAGTEMDIKADGSLDYPDEVLAQLDFVIASLHSGLSQKREQVDGAPAQSDPQPLRPHDRASVGAAIPQSRGRSTPIGTRCLAAAAEDHDTILEINANPLASWISNQSWRVWQRIWAFCWR